MCTWLGTQARVWWFLLLVVAGPVATLSAAEPFRIDVLVVYTPEARDDVGGAAAMATFVDLSMRSTNEALARSDAGVVVNLVGLRELAYTEASAPLNFQRFTTRGDGYMDEIFTWREELGADLLGIVLRAGGNVAIVPPPAGAPEQPFFAINTGDRFGYNQHAFPHEVAHTLGAGHHWQSSQTAGAFVYSHDQVTAGQYFNYSEVMVSGGPPPSTITGPIQASPLRCANPRVFYDGVPTGTPEGQFEPADNARTIRTLGPLVSAYRAAVSAPGPAPARVEIDEREVLIKAPGFGASFSAHVSGTPYPSVRWQRSTDGGLSWTDMSDGGDVSGTATPTLSIAAVTAGMDGDQFRLRAVTSGASVASDPAVLLVNITLGAVQQSNFEFSGRPDTGWQEFVPRVDFIHAIEIFGQVSGRPGPVRATLETVGGQVTLDGHIRDVVSLPRAVGVGEASDRARGESDADLQAPIHRDRRDHRSGE